VQARADAQMQHDSAVADRVQMQAKLRRAQAELDAAKQQQGASAAQCEQWQAERQSLQQQAQAAAKQAEAAGAKCSAADDEMQRLHWQLNALHTEHQKVLGCDTLRPGPVDACVCAPGSE
jgi:seryl-tRNA synthetase